MIPVACAVTHPDHPRSYGIFGTSEGLTAFREQVVEACVAKESVRLGCCIDVRAEVPVFM